MRLDTAGYPSTLYKLCCKCLQCMPAECTYYTGRNNTLATGQLLLLLLDGTMCPAMQLGQHKTPDVEQMSRLALALSSF